MKTPKSAQNAQSTTFYFGGALNGTESHWHYQTADQRR